MNFSHKRAQRTQSGTVLSLCFLCLLVAHLARGLESDGGGFKSSAPEAPYSSAGRSVSQPPPTPAGRALGQSARNSFFAGGNEP